MRFFQDILFRCYYWNDKRIKYLHEKVLRNHIGLYEGFFNEYGQALRINCMSLINEKDIIQNVKESKDIKDKIDDKGKYNNYIRYDYKYLKIFKKSKECNAKLNNLLYKFIEFYFQNVLDAKTIRAG